MAARLYDLSSTWTIPNSREEVWEVIADPAMSWQLWWPGCSRGKPNVETTPSGPDPRERLLATTATLNFKAALGYTLSVACHPTLVERPDRIAFDATGDLAGQGRVTLSSLADGSTRLDIEWRVRPTPRWMRLLDPVAGPVFKHAHDGLMRRGEEGLRAYLAQPRS